MLDLAFDIETREVQTENGDFQIAENPSIQNGGILLYSQNALILNPTLGIGINGVIGSPVSKVAYEMNRWKKQAMDDSAKNASYTITNDSNDYANVEIKFDISY